MNHPPTASPARLIGVSVPRSGHHYLVRLLGHALGESFVHCEYYTPVGCCRTTPCTRSEGARVVSQKNHDLDFSLSPDLAGVTYVVQHREPLMAALSDREYLARLEGRELADDADEYVVWLGEKAAYFHRFWAKWLRPPHPHRLVIDYGELLHRPVEALAQTLVSIGVEVDRSRLEEAARRVSPSVADFPAPLGEPPPFTARTLEASRYLDRDLLSVFESIVLDAVPELLPTRCLPKVPWRSHPMALVYAARLRQAAGDREGAAALLAEATLVTPDNPYLWHELGAARSACGDIEGALAAAGESIRLRPVHPLFLRQQGDLHAARSLEDLDRAIRLARGLVQLRPRDAGHLIHLASLLSRRREHVEAEGIAAFAITLGHADPHLWREASEIFAAAENWEAAIGTARDAILRDETAAEFHHHLGNMLKRVGRIEEAIAAQGRALRLAPDNQGWQRSLVQLQRRREQQIPAVWDLPPADGDVVMAYRLLLGRDPESEDVVRHHASMHADRRSLLRAFLSSEEFASRMAGGGAPRGLAG